MDENVLLDMDFQGLSDSDLTVLFTIGDEPILKTRLQKIALLFDEMNDSHGPGTERGLRFFGGYSDEIDESTITLTSAGILDETSHWYVMTAYGRKLKEYTERCIENDEDETGMTIIRGIRTVRDFEYEETIADINRKLSGIETILLFTEPEQTSVSSTIVRELLQFGKDVSPFLPEGMEI